MVSQEQETRPGDIDLGEFRRIGREVIDAIADLPCRPLPPQCPPERHAGRGRSPVPRRAPGGGRVGRSAAHRLARAGRAAVDGGRLAAAFRLCERIRCNDRHLRRGARGVHEHQRRSVEARTGRDRDRAPVPALDRGLRRLSGRHGRHPGFGRDDGQLHRAAHGAAPRRPLRLDRRTGSRTPPGADASSSTWPTTKATSRLRVSPTC